jgi:hypothetical protein
VKKVLERFGMENAKPVSTPLANHFRLFASQCLKTVEKTEDVLKLPYVNAIGYLMYALVCTRPDLAYVVSMVKVHDKSGETALGCS